MVKGKASRGDEEESHPPLQAVVLADSFTHRFRPITLESPKVLLPLVNVPMLDYTLEWLASAGVEEAFVFCCAHAQKVEAHLQEAGWLSMSSFKVTTVTSTDCTSAGDALRFIDQRNCVRGDFVLVSGDVVANFKLEDALALHRERRKKDKQAIMTIMTKKLSGASLKRFGYSDLVVGIDPDSKQLMTYQEERAHTQKGTHVRVESKFFKGRKSVQLRTDVMDCHIDICAPEVLVDFRENFDYQQVRRDFVGGVLIDEEMGNKIFVHELTDRDYAVQILNLRTYDAVSRDIIQRWVYPFVPDNSVTPSQMCDPGYQYLRGNIYRQEGLNIARSATIGNNSVLATGCRVGENTVIRASVLGKNCVIGSNCVIDGCYLNDNVVVGNNVKMVSSLLCAQVTVHNGVKLEEGSILSYGVVCGKDFNVAALSRVSLFKQVETDDIDSSEDESEQPADPNASTLKQMGGLAYAMERKRLDAARDGTLSAEKSIWDANHVGTGGAGFLWQKREDVDSEEEFQYSVGLRWRLYVGKNQDLLMDEDECSDDEMGVRSRGGAAQANVEEDGEEVEEEDPEVIFKCEVTETFLRCVRMQYDQGNAVVELNALKLAEDRTFADLSRYIFTALLALALPPSAEVHPDNVMLYATEVPECDKELMLALKKRLETWGPLLQRFLKNKDDQVELLLTLEEMCLEEGVFEASKGSRYTSVFVQTLQLLYNMDVVTEEAVITWDEEKKHADEEDRKFAILAAPFVTWLKEAEEDSSEEEDEDDEEDDEDDQDE